MSYDLSQARLLIVDDMTPMLDLTKTILSVFGFKQINTAQNGEDAYEKLCRYDPDLVICDWIMEPMDGLEFAKMVRRNPLSPNPYVPILIMTGFSARIRVEAARDAGITEFLVKPFSSHDLYTRIAQIVEKPRQFVDSGAFFGPDRRRKRGVGYMGPKRREVDESTQTSRHDEAILKQLRQDVKDLKND